MGTGQMILTVGAMTLLGLLILTANSSILENDRVVSNSEFGVAAVSIATSIIEEAQGKAFDDAVVDSGLTNPLLFTAPALMHQQSSEYYRPIDSTYTDFDDLNDFNGFWIEYVADSSKPQIATYRGESKGFRADYFVRSAVSYVTAGGGSANPDGTSLIQTLHKKLTVTVTSPSSTDTLTLSTIISYWN